jgi:hypothetical protein
MYHTISIKQIFKNNNLFTTLFQKQINKNTLSLCSFFAGRFWNTNKFIVYNDVLTNMFISQDEKTKFFNLFYLTQKRYHIFKKMYNNLTRHKIKTFSNDLDLTFNVLEKETKKVIQLIHEKKFYFFKISDLIKIITINLLHADNLFASPKHPTNPFTNTRFTYTNLLNIYFHMQDNNMYIPTIFTLFLKSNFNVKNFFRLNQSYIRNRIINNYYKYKPISVKYRDIIFMLRYYNRVLPKRSKIFIHPEFSKDLVVEAFEKCLKKYLLAQHSLHPSLRSYSDKENIDFIKEFNKNDPKFGRVYIIRKKIFPDPNYIKPKFKYRILNMLSNEIPNFTSVTDIVQYMKLPETPINNASTQTNNINIIDIDMDVNDNDMDDNDDQDDNNDDQNENTNDTTNPANLPEILYFSDYETIL